MTVHTYKGQDIVVIVKRTKTVFEAHKETFYRCSASKRNNYQNELTLQPKDNDLKKFW